MEELRIFAGSSNGALAEEICGALGTGLGKLEIARF